MTSVIERLGLWSPPYSIEVDGGFIHATKGDYSVTVRLDDWNQWRSASGVPIQNQMPYLTDEQREFLISGTTPAEWAATFPPEDSE